MTSLSKAQLSSLFDQRPISRGIPQKILFDSIDYINGATVDGGDITVSQTGVYFIVASPQVNELYNICDYGVQYIDFWIDVNNVAVQNSAVRLSLSNRKETDVIVSQGIVPLNQGDKVSVWMNVVGHGTNCTQAGIAYFPPSVDGATAVPSIIFSLFGLA